MFGGLSMGKFVFTDAHLRRADVNPEHNLINKFVCRNRGHSGDICFEYHRWIHSTQNGFGTK
jgi:hypothetical protein